jgi:hypothetical protein
MAVRAFGKPKAFFDLNMVKKKRHIHPKAVFPAAEEGYIHEE